METVMKTPLIKSPFIQIVREGDKAIIWHSLFGFPKIVSMETVDFLDMFAGPRKLQTIYDEFEVDVETQRMIQELVESYFLIPNELDERRLLSEKMKLLDGKIPEGALINYLGFVISEECNFRCVYCIHSNNLKASKRLETPKKLMTFEMSCEAIAQYLRILQKHGKNTADINFGGGEPLICWKVIKRVLEFCHKEYGNEFTFKFSLNTNASLITPEIASILKQYRVEVAASLDGLREGNDAVRMTRKGKGTFNTIMRGFDLLAKHNYPLEGIAMTINEYNFPYLDERILDWCSRKGMKEVRIDIDVIGIVDVPTEAIAEKLISLKRYARYCGLEIAGFWSRPVENLNTSSLNDYVTFCGSAGGRSMCVTPSGGIYSCGYSKNKLGTVTNIATFLKHGGKYHQMIRERLPGKIEMCQGCMIECQCNGGCSITRENSSAKRTAKVDRMCTLYRIMTEKLLREQLLID